MGRKACVGEAVPTARNGGVASIFSKCHEWLRFVGSACGTGNVNSPQPRLASVPVMPSPTVSPAAPAPDDQPPERTKTADLEAISFKVPPAFRKRFRQRAIDADLKLNELLFAALDAWEEKRGIKSKNS